MASTNPARGMRDFLPADVRKREYVIGIIKSVYESYGFEPLETPAVENIETLMGKYGDEGNQLIFKILKRGEKLDESMGSLGSDGSPGSLSDLALRYDLTVPLARVVADRRNDLPKFFKRYQIQPVWRADRPARGRFREFYQCDVDAIGSSSMTVEAELVSSVCEILVRLGFEKFIVRINHRDILSGVLTVAGVPESLQTATLVVLDKRDKLSSEQFTSELNSLGLPSGTATRFIDFFSGFFSTEAGSIGEDLELLGEIDFAALARKEISLTADQLKIIEKHIDPVALNQSSLDKISGFAGTHSETQRAVKQLRALLLLLQGDYGRYISIDPSLARGLSYYTGTIMEINVPDLAGSLGGGGRYDGLIGMFGKEQIPACGFSLGLERILVVMDERGMFPPEIADSTPADVLVTIFSEETVADSLKLANELRAQGLRVSVYPEPDKLGKQIKYADQIKVPFVCVLGESEINEGRVTVKNMKTGEQNTIPNIEVATDIKKQLSAVSN